MHVGIVLLVVLCFLFIGCDKGIPYDEGTVDVYFCPEEDCRSVWMEVFKTESGFLCAFYDLSDNEFIDFLQKRNAEVLVYEENFDGYGRYVYSKGLMHNKFCVGEDLVVTGSVNPTGNGFEKNQNNLVVIESDLIAENYRREWDELRDYRAYATPYPVVNLSGRVVETLFCPEDGCSDRVGEILGDGRESVDFAVFSFTDKRLGSILVGLKGVESRGLFDPRLNEKYSVYGLLEEHSKKYAGSGKLHHKFFVVDGSVVVTGSYNPSKNGNERNDENLLIIWDEDIATEYEEEFERLWN
ncbi:hypothetical protein CMO92_01055 [Candidatus Woesearchaeota archaeon]|nr:hypothetical protein [Candidatus Woesearchaeota archaeon]